jgi:hypothetical protein
MRSIRFAALFLVFFSTAVGAETALIGATQDNTLYESPTGRLSNGRGEHMFVGLTAGNEKRRAVIAFKNLEAIPAGATITSVRMHLLLTRQNSGLTRIALHRITDDWGEGVSIASEEEGRGANSAPDDATWAHRFYSLLTWDNLGGDFVETPSDEQFFDSIGVYTFGSTDQMVADVQAWVDDDSLNFGWILVGNETAPSSKRFATKDNANPDFHPVLEVEFSTTGTANDFSGPWFDPALDGEGYLVYQTPAGWLFYFFGYSKDGQFTWIISNVVTLEDLVWGEPFELPMLIGEPGTFEMPTPSTELKPYGTLSVRFDTCTSGQFVLDGLDGVKTSEVIKIVDIDGSNCSGD